MSSLFESFSYKSLTLPNRVVMAPMTRSFSPRGVPAGNVADYYRRRAEGAVGLIITEGTGIGRPASLNHPDVPQFHGAAALDGWREVVKAVHQAGGRIAPQLWHVGAAPDLVHNSVMPEEPESPSGLFSPTKALGRSMSDVDIADTIQAYVEAALDAQRLGFDCIEIHAAHGYLFDQFFWPVTNLRQDGYGGDMANRGRFAVEAIKAIRAAVGNSFVILMRISQWKQQDFDAKVAASPSELEAWLAPLADAGVDIFHCSQRRFWEAEFDDSSLNFAGWTKKVTGLPTITVGSVGLSGEFIDSLGGQATTPESLDHLLERLARDEFDLVAVGRALLSDPDWLAKVRDGRHQELRSFDAADLSRLF